MHACANVCIHMARITADTMSSAFVPVLLMEGDFTLVDMYMHEIQQITRRALREACMQSKGGPIVHHDWGFQALEHEMMFFYGAEIIEIYGRISRVRLQFDPWEVQARIMRGRQALSTRGSHCVYKSPPISWSNITQKNTQNDSSKKNPVLDDINMSMDSLPLAILETSLHSRRAEQHHKPKADQGDRLPWGCSCAFLSEPICS
jgi:hypothetical protein